MKFRIIETHLKYQRLTFKPQYKRFLFWNDIAETTWVDTIFCKYKFNSDNSLYSKYEAQKCIEDFKIHEKQCEEYIIIIIELFVILV